MKKVLPLLQRLWICFHLREIVVRLCFSFNFENKNKHTELRKREKQIRSLSKRSSQNNQVQCDMTIQTLEFLLTLLIRCFLGLNTRHRIFFFSRFSKNFAFVFLLSSSTTHRHIFLEQTGTTYFGEICSIDFNSLIIIEYTVSRKKKVQCS